MERQEQAAQCSEAEEEAARRRTRKCARCASSSSLPFPLLLYRLPSARRFSPTMSSTSDDLVPAITTDEPLLISLSLRRCAKRGATEWRASSVWRELRSVHVVSAWLLVSNHVRDREAATRTLSP